MGYSFDPELAQVVALLPPGDLADIGAARTQLDQMASLQPPYAATGRLTITNRSIPRGDGSGTVSVRVYAPSGLGGAHAALLFIHGGGFVIGNLELDDAWCAECADILNVVVVSVDYRLAPEHPFPAALEDCYTALCWMSLSADSLGVDPERFGVSGVSAGGGLAAALALLARDRGGPLLSFQSLATPELDDRMNTSSMQAFVDTPMWSKPLAERSWALYLGDDITPGGSEVSPYAAPARAESLADLPPTYISVCEFDPLRDEGITYASRLVQAGVATELHLYPGTFHGSAQVVPEASVSRRMRTEESAALQRGLRAQGSVPSLE